MAYSIFPTSLKSQIEGSATSAHWPLDDTDNGAWEDYSGNDNHLQARNAPVFDDDTTVTNFGPRGHAYFGGLAVGLATTHLPVSNGSFSFSTWVNLYTGVGSLAWNDNRNLFWNFRWDFIKLSGNQVVTFENSLGNDVDVNTKAGIQDDTWHHVVITYNSSNNTMSYYRDGSLIASQSSGSPIATVDRDFRMGNNSSSGPTMAVQETSYFDGYVLDSDEVSSLYNDGDGVGWNYDPFVASYAASGGLSMSSSAEYSFIENQSNTSSPIPPIRDPEPVVLNEDLIPLNFKVNINPQLDSSNRIISNGKVMNPFSLYPKWLENGETFVLKGEQGRYTKNNYTSGILNDPNSTPFMWVSE